MTIGQRIKALREQCCMTQVDLADKIGVSKQNLYKYENGVITNIPSDKIEQIAIVLGTTPAYLMGWVETIADVSTIELSDHEIQLVHKYRSLDDYGRSMIDKVIVMECDRCAAQSEEHFSKLAARNGEPPHEETMTQSEYDEMMGFPVISPPNNSQK